MTENSNNLDIFSWEDLRRMTHNFSDDNMLGHSRFAVVFKGTIVATDLHVTVKCFKDDDSESNIPWRLKNEIDFLLDPEVNHLYFPNILGACWGDCGVFSIVYNLHPDCILSKVVFKDRLTWVHRIQIGLKIASLLQYLHGLHPCISFDNLSSDDFILDEAGNPILYEFGYQFGMRNPHDSHGMGYPGDISSGVQTTCSFGYILISLLHHDDKERELLKRIFGVRADENTWTVYRNKYSDIRYGFRLNPEKLEKCPYFYSYDAHKLSKLAIRCISSSVDERPSMDEIVMEFQRLFYMCIHHFTSLPISGVQEMSYDEIYGITKGFSSFIGETQFGRLYRGLYRDMEVTVKLFRDEPLLSDRKFLLTGPSDNIYRLKDEILLLSDNRAFNFPCFPKLISFCCEDKGKKMAVVYNFKTSCTLHACISDDSFTWINRIGVMNQGARLVQHMHNYDPPFIVGNISSHHFLLDEDMQMFIVDFGLLTGGFLGVKKEGKYRKYDGAVGYVDQNSRFLTDKWGPRVDVYALGVLLVELLQKSPVADYSSQEFEFDPRFISNMLNLARHQDPNPTRALVDSVINNDLKIDPYYCDVDAFKLVSIANFCVCNLPRRSGINGIIRELDGLMLDRPRQNISTTHLREHAYILESGAYPQCLMPGSEVPM